MKTITNILLIVLASILLMTVGVFGVIYQMISNYKKKYYFMNIAVSLDQLGNVLCGALFDMVLIKKGTAFGNVDDTISEVLAKEKGNLTLLGSSIATLLDKIDRGHLLKSVIE